MKIVTITLQIDESVLDGEIISSILVHVEGCTIFGYSEFSLKDQ